MADKMTLELIRNELREFESDRNHYLYAGDLADAIDAHIAAMGEPVAWQMTVETHKKKPKWRDCSFKEYASIAATGLFVSPDGLTFPAKARVLYTDQPASGDWDAVRTLVATWRRRADGMYRAEPANRVRDCANDLEAALPENAK